VRAWGVRAQAVLIAVVLFVGGARAATYERPRPPGVPGTRFWAALLNARSARIEMWVTEPAREQYYAEGTIEFATRRTSLTVSDARGEGGTRLYDEVTDRTLVYQRGKPGRWYRFVEAGDNRARPLHLLTLLTEVTSFQLVGSATLHNAADTDIFLAMDKRPDLSFEAYVDDAGLPRRLLLQAPYARLDVYLDDFLAPPPVVPPLRSVPVADREAARQRVRT
jgi:hypothetical protein